jgi:hypothetical protein
MTMLGRAESLRAAPRGASAEGAAAPETTGWGSIHCLRLNFADLSDHQRSLSGDMEK